MHAFLVTRLHLPTQKTHIIGLHREAEGARHMMNADVVKTGRAYSDSKAKGHKDGEDLSLDNFEWAVDDHPVSGNEGMVYVLEYSVPYEGCSLCGVFESKDEAICAARKVECGDELEIRECGLNCAHRQYSFEEKPVIPHTDWTLP
jgi:hypothetical protein